MVIDGEARKYAAALGRRYVDGSVTMDALRDHFGNTEDPLIQELLIAIVHEPRRGFWGVRESQWQKSFWRPVSHLLTELERGADGRVPDVTVVKTSGWTFLGFTIFILWAGASVAKHSLALWGGTGSWWSSAGHAVLVVVWAFATLGGIIGLRDRLVLRRLRQANRRGSDTAG